MENVAMLESKGLSIGMTVLHKGCKKQIVGFDLDRTGALGAIKLAKILESGKLSKSINKAYFGEFRPI